MGHGEMQIILKGLWACSLLVSNAEGKTKEINLPKAKEACLSVKASNQGYPRSAALPWDGHETDLLWLGGLCCRSATEQLRCHDTVTESVFTG